MKAILEFDFENDDDRKAHLRCMMAIDMAIVLWELNTNLEKKCKHIAECQEADSDVHDGVYIVFEQIRELLNEYGIDTDTLID